MNNKISNPFILLLLKEQEDFLIVTKSSCLKCTENKTGYTILNKYPCSEKDAIQALKPIGGKWVPRIHNIKCVCK